MYKTIMEHVPIRMVRIFTNIHIVNNSKLTVYNKKHKKLYTMNNILLTVYGSVLCYNNMVINYEQNNIYCTIKICD